MNSTTKEVLEFVCENDVKFIQLNFCDLFGNQKNIAIMPHNLQEAFESGISFDASSIKGFSDVEQSDLLLFPDPATLSLMPWRSGQGRVIRFFCDIKNPDKTPFDGDTRNILKAAVSRAEDMGLVCKIGSECEFYLFKTDENGDPTNVTIDNGGYFDISPLDKGENVRREICLCLEEMGIKPDSSHHEDGPGQNEIDFEYSDVLSAADNFLAFKSTVKAIAATNGLFASFMPKPLKNNSGNGLHINISLSQNGMNIFKNTSLEHSKIAHSFIAGILAKVTEMTLFLNPITNSYERFGYFRAPQYISWSHQNRSQLIRIPAATGEKMRMELRSPDPSLNPYIAFALVLNAGLDGIANGLKLWPPSDINLYKAKQDALCGLTKLPQSLSEALDISSNSNFVKKYLNQNILTKYFNEKKIEITDFEKAKDNDEFYTKTYFYMI